MKTNNAYDFDQYGHLIDFNPFQRVVPFPQTQEQKQLYQKAAVRPKTHKVDPSSIALDYSRDSLLTNFGKATLDDRFLILIRAARTACCARNTTNSCSSARIVVAACNRRE